MNWPKKVNWLAWSAVIVVGIVVLAVIAAAINGTSKQLTNGYGKAITDAGNE